MSTLGIDYGSSKIGLAKSDDTNSLALPLEILSNTGQDDVMVRLGDICHHENITKIVVGVPVSLSTGNSQELLREVDLSNKHIQEVLGFINLLKETLNIQVEMEDERMSTKMAITLNKGMIKNGSDDDVAAMLILQSYLDKNKN